MRRRALSWLAAGTSAAALAAIFMAYLEPETMMVLATRVWACF